MVLGMEEDVLQRDGDVVQEWQNLSVRRWETPKRVCSPKGSPKSLVIRPFRSFGIS